MAKIIAFLQGVVEFRSSFTTHQVQDNLRAYDTGRELMHRITLRHFEEN